MPQEGLQTLEATAYRTDSHWRLDGTPHSMFIEGSSDMVMARILEQLRATSLSA